MIEQQSLFTIRPARIEDAQKVTDLIIASDIAEYGVPDCMIEDVIGIWEEVPIESNTWIIQSEDAFVAYGYVEEMSKGRLDCYGFVHPDWYGKGARTLLLEQMEQCAATYIEDYENHGIKYELNHVIPARNEKAIALFESKGYSYVRTYSRMVIEVNSVPEIIPTSNEVTLLPCDMERDAHGLFDAYTESFKDTRGYYEKPFDEWIQKVTTEVYDLSLWFVAYRGDELVGFIICKNFPEGTYVDLLGVKRSGRKMGIGASLLTTVFKESYQRGISSVLLNVDSNSLTGANRLYENVGMKPMFQMSMYQKTN
ncbi:GNAT family N-acetyltransferase [Bacillus salitolerans]|uniref:GNAT family N-acetyltransferase n=1 Tax=Bacillus salitolerans TaxID=1437434 RepID=A0ABW4LKV4_9BACI